MGPRSAARAVLLLTLGLLAARPAAAELREVRLADHRGRWTADGVGWQSRVLLEDEPRAGDTVRFAWPLDGQPQSPDVERWLEDADGHVVAAVLRDGDAWLHLDLDQPSVDGLPPGALKPPAVEGDGAQRVIVDGLVYRPRDGLDLEARLKRTVHSAIDRRARLRLDNALDGRRARPRDHPVYFVVDGPLREAGGLAGEVRVRGRVGQEVLFASTGAFAAVVLGLFGVGRLLARRVREEEIDAYLAREFVPPEGGAQPKEARK